MHMHMGRKVVALGLTALVLGAGAGSAFAATNESSAVASSSVSASAVPPIQKLTPEQVAQKLGVPTKALLDALADAKAQVKAAGVDKDAARDLTIKVLAHDLHITQQLAAWAADELLGGHIVGVPAK